MKSRRNEAVLGLLLVSLVAASDGQAEITPRPDAVRAEASRPDLRKTRPTAVESMARVVDEGPRSVLRCWQEGRLVFEGANLQMVGATDAGGAGAALKGADGRTVQLLDLRQGLCVFERSKG